MLRFVALLLLWCLNCSLALRLGENNLRLETEGKSEKASLLQTEEKVWPFRPTPAPASASIPASEDKIKSTRAPRKTEKKEHKDKQDLKNEESESIAAGKKTQPTWSKARRI